MTHWSVGTPFERVKAGIVGYDGAPWDLSPNNPPPPGFVVDGGRLHRLAAGSPATGGGVSWDAPDFDTLVADARRIIGPYAAALASPGPCGECVPCRNRSSDQCIASPHQRRVFAVARQREQVYRDSVALDADLAAAEDRARRAELRRLGVAV